MKFLIVLACTVLLSSLAHAHARLKPSTTIAIRGTNPGIKTGPCGGLARVTPAMVASGSTITVTWEETVYHPGRFEFYLSTGNDQNFTLLKTYQHDQNNGNTPHQFSTTVTLPNVTCTACTFQMIQVMLENPNNPTYYYSCSDMQLTTGPTPTPGPSPTPLPQATPDPSCKTDHSAH